MSVGSADNVRSRRVDGAMDQESCFVQNLDPSMVKDVALMIDTEQIAFVDAVEIDAEWVDPMMEATSLAFISDQQKMSRTQSWLTRRYRVRQDPER